MNLKQSQFLNLNLYQKMENNTKAKSEANEAETVEEFNWDNPIGKDNNEFFGNKPEKTKSKVEQLAEEDDNIEIEGEETEETENEETEETEEEKEKKKEEEENNNKNKPKSTKKKEEVENIENIEDKDKSRTSNDTFSILAEELKEEGILEYVDLPKKKDLTAKELKELVSKDKELAVENGLKDLFEGLDEKGADYLKFIKNGGKTQDFIDTFVNNAIPDIDITDTKTHKSIILLYAETVEGLDEEDAIAKYDSLKENKTDAKYAERYYKKLKEIEAEEQQDLLEKTQKRAKKEEKERETFADELSVSLKKEEILGISLTDKDKRLLPNIITKASKVVGGRKVTEFQNKLNNALKNPEKIILLAKILEDDFKFAFIEDKIKSKTTKGIKRSLENIKENGKDTRSTGNQNQKKSLADFFPDN